MATPYCCMWEFVIAPESIAAFRTHYDPAGTWVALFKQDAAFIETLLLEDSTAPGRFVTVDRWRSEAAYHAFRERCADQYDALDKVCDGLTLRETYIGGFIEHHPRRG